ncbi:MAG: F0F1 ATP synthase subunit A [bacterium]|nr:F0F1 ATP synthase subunit A [bacterium]
MLAATETEAAHGAAEHAEETFDAGAHILGHVLDSNSYHIPWTNDGHFDWPQFPKILGIDFSITNHVVAMWIVFALLLLGFTSAVRAARKGKSTVLRGMLEVLVSFIRDDVARKAIGPGADRFVGYLLTTFFFIVCCNLLGLIPGMATATGNIAVTMGLAVAAFLVVQYCGIREYGVVKHFKNLVPHGLPFWLVPIMFALELLTTLIRPFALCIRLFANMMAGHVALLAMITLIFLVPQFWYAAIPGAIGFALFVYLLEILVAFLQAYIFTMLTAQFIGMSLNPSH